MQDFTFKDLLIVYDPRGVFLQFLQFQKYFTMILKAQKSGLDFYDEGS